MNASQRLLVLAAVVGLSAIAALFTPAPAKAFRTLQY